MILNKEILIELVVEQCMDEIFCVIDGDIDYLHDVCLNVDILGLNPEVNVIMYGELDSLLNRYGYDIGEEIDAIMDKECVGYLGEPAFASASDYWNYILG